MTTKTRNNTRAYARGDASSHAAIEICGSMLHVAILRGGAAGDAQVQVQSIPWRKTASTLHSATGAAELTDALRAVVQEHRLNGAKARLALNGAFCVTRVVRDTADRVRREISDLEERCKHYLALGTGPKALAASIRQVDARHQHAMVTVCNQKTLDVIVQAAGAVGLRLDRIEPSLMSLCRLIQYLEPNDEEPSSIIHLDEGGAELGIAHVGELLLDFRPGGRGERHNAADLVKQHLERLRRYCNRNYSLEFGSLKRVYLSGPDAIVEQVRGSLAADGQLTPQVIDLSRFAVPGSLAATGAAAAAAIGSCLAEFDKGTPSPAPNLLDRMVSTSREGLVRSLVLSLMPLAALLMVAVGLATATYFQARACDELEVQLNELAPARAKATTLRLTLERSELKLANLQIIAQQVRNPHWDRLVTTLGQCLPPDVWLDLISVDEHGRMSLTGSSFADAGVYEFVNGIKLSPAVTDVALKATHPGGSILGPVTNFDVECKFAGQAELAQEHD